MLRHRAGTADLTQKPPGLGFAAARKFRAARFRVRYRMWQIDLHLALWNLSSHLLREQLAYGEGRVEFMELPHQYLRLTSLVGAA